MKLFRFLAFSCFALCLSTSFAQYPLKWSAFIDSGLPTNEGDIKILAASDGGSFLFGSDSAGTVGQSTGSSILAKVADSGAVLWTRTVQGLDGDMAANATGAVTLTYTNREPTFRNSSTIERFGLAGNVIWSRTIALPKSNVQYDNLVDLDSTGNVYVGESYFNSAALKKFDATTGNLVFSVALPAGMQDATVKCNTDGTVYVSSAASVSNSFGAAISKYDANGNVLWSKSYAGIYKQGLFDSAGNAYLLYSNNNTLHVIKHAPNGSVVWDSANAVYYSYAAVSPTGAVAVDGGFNGTGSLTLIGSNGVLQWTKTAGTNGGPVAFDGSGNIFAYSNDPAAPSLMKFDPNGNVTWSQTQGLTTPVGGASAIGMYTDSVGRAVLATFSYSAATYADMGILTFSSNGTFVWGDAIDDGKAYDYAVDAVTDTTGNTYVTGLGQDVFTLSKISANGTPSWTRNAHTFRDPVRVAGPCLGPNGVVAGISWDPSDDYNASLGIFEYDVNGNLLWTYSDFATFQVIKDIKVAADGSVFVCLDWYDPNTFQIFLRIIKLNANGTMAWIADRPGVIGSYDDRPKIVLDATGAVYASFSVEVQQNPTINKAALEKFDPTGNPSWSKILDSAYVDGCGDGVAINSLGQVVWVARQSDPNTLVDNEAVYKFDSSGNLLGSVIASDFPGPQLKIDSADNIFLATDYGKYAIGQEYPGVQKITPNLVSAWTTWITDNNYNSPYHLAVDNQGGAFLALPTKTASDNHERIYRLNASGARAWNVNGGFFLNGSLIHDLGPIEEMTNAIGLDSIGDLFVSSSTFGPSGSHDINVIKYGAMNSAFVAQTVPSSMTAGQTYYTTTTFQNTGIETWTNALGYKLGIINSPTWGVVSAPLAASDSIAPGQSKKFTYNIYAPTTPGTYMFQTRMYKHGSSLGPLSPAVTVAVALAADATRYVSQTVPSTVKAGATFNVTVTMRNVGTNTWTQAGGYVLAPASGYPTWNVTAIPLAVSDSIAPGSSKTFTFAATAPPTPGTYSMRFQMEKGSTFFGDRTTTKTITVTT